jgi:hypothetical protein
MVQIHAALLVSTFGKNSKGWSPGWFTAGIDSPQFPPIPTAMTSPSAPRAVSAILSMLTLASIASAQIATTYSFAQQLGTYTPIVGGTQVDVVTGTTGVTSLDDNVYPVSLPFPFFFNGVTHTSGNLSTNGFFTFGATTPGTTNYVPLSSTIA